MRKLKTTELSTVSGGRNQNSGDHRSEALKNGIQVLTIIQNGLTNGDSGAKIGKTIGKYFHDKYYPNEPFPSDPKPAK